MSEWLAAEISLFRGAMDVTPAKAVTIGAVLNAIRTGAYRQHIERLRRLRAVRGQDAYAAAKTRLDAVTFGGTFAPTRRKATLVQHSGIVHGDIDHVPDVHAGKQALCAAPYTAYGFVSPGGDGLKIGTRIPFLTTDEEYKHAWQAVADYYYQQYGVPWDPSGTDVCRLCFVSWDPDLYLSADAQCFPVPPLPVTPPRPLVTSSPRLTIPGDRRAFYARQALDTATKMLDASTPGTRHFWRRKAAYLLGGYVAGGILSYEDARAVLEAAVDRNTAHLKKAMKTVDACLEAGMREAITLEELERERRAWRAATWRKRAKAWTGTLRAIAVEGGTPWH